MSFFQRVVKTVVIDEENSITIRALTYGEEQEVKALAMKTKADFKGNGEMSIDATLLERAAFHLAIVGWSGPGFEGRPVTHENIDQLPPWILDMLKEPLNELRAQNEAASSQKKALIDITS